MNFQHKSVFETHSHSFFSIFIRNSHGGVTFQRICFFAGEHCRFYICDVWSVENPFKVEKMCWNKCITAHDSHIRRTVFYPSHLKHFVKPFATQLYRTLWYYADTVFTWIDGVSTTSQLHHRCGRAQRELFYESKSLDCLKMEKRLVHSWNPIKIWKLSSIWNQTWTTFVWKFYLQTTIVFWSN